MLQKSTTEKTLEVFFNEPTKKHYLKEISQKIKVAHTSIIKILLNLQKEKIINRIEKKYGKRNFPFFVANINNDEFKILKKINNLKSVYYSGIINFLELNFMPKSIILFGSYSRGEDIEGSDIDLFLETKEEEINLIRFEKILSRKINIYFKEDINECSKELQNNILNGILLKGELEFK
ncbi:MAG TPA: nucleotidyltransferase domain-containing protein [Candidatus Nanoarchaeia archaeon]|nr:nucleotidyltransferase domain-containing protein [Candidatus Nanoarchaeia archaeon]